MRPHRGRSSARGTEATADGGEGVGGLRWILEADIVSCFDSVDRTKLKEMLEIRAAGGSLLRLIGKCLPVGVLTSAELATPENGTAQGSVLSPLLGNVHLHYVLEPTDAARAARGKRVRIEEREDGWLCLWNGEHARLATAFPKEHAVQATEVVESKRLAETMEFIEQRQRERTEAKLEKPFTTLRKARLLRAGTPRRTATGASPVPQR